MVDGGGVLGSAVDVSQNCCDNPLDELRVILVLSSHWLHVRVQRLLLLVQSRVMRWRTGQCHSPYGPTADHAASCWIWAVMRMMVMMV